MVFHRCGSVCDKPSWEIVLLFQTIKEHVWLYVLNVLCLETFRCNVFNLSYILAVSILDVTSTL